MLATFTVLSTGDGDGMGADLTLTLRQAINRANQAGGQEVHVINFGPAGEVGPPVSLPGGGGGGNPDPGYVIKIGSQLPEINCNVYINGAYAPGQRVTVRRDAAKGDFRLFELWLDSSAVFASLKLRDGFAPGIAGIAGLSGGAILARGKSLVVTNCEIRDNNAGGAGGGIAVEGPGGGGTGGTLEVYDSLITNNGSGETGGGIYFTGSSMIMSNSRVTANTAQADGGGIWLARFTGAQVTVTLNHVEIDHNQTQGNGGGIYCGSVQTFIVRGDSNIHDNTASGKGGGIYLSPAFSATLQDVTLANNKAATGRGMYVGWGTIANWTVGPGAGQLHLGGTPVDDIVTQP